ncbi:MAG: TIGR03792 family protein [Leptolyngbya sp. BL-A-14]
MVIEWLKIQVVPELREKYIQKDEEIWTAALAKVPGYAGKQVWIDPNNADKVVLVIHWATREAWKAVPAKLLEATEMEFAQQMGKDNYKIIEEGEYQVRKFPQRPA